MLEQYLTAENFKVASIVSMATLHAVGDLRLIYGFIKSPRNHKKRRAELVEKAKNGSIDESTLEEKWHNNEERLVNSIKTTLWKRYLPLQIAALASIVPFGAYMTYNYFCN